MKRDFDLARSLLLQIEAVPAGEAISNLSDADASGETLTAHLVLLIEAGLVEGTTLKTTTGPRVKPLGLTWAGHDFLDSIRDPSIWEKAKTSILKPAGGVAFSVLLEWAKHEAKARLGLPS